MANEVKLPRLGQGMEAGTITKWLKSPGDTVAKGEPLFEIDTDKVTQEVESDYAGVLLKIKLESGEAPVGRTIAYIGKEGEEAAQTEEPPESAASTSHRSRAPAPTAASSPGTSSVARSRSPPRRRRPRRAARSSRCRSRASARRLRAASPPPGRHRSSS